MLFDLFITGNLLTEIEENLWPYCGSSFAFTASTLTGINLQEKISRLVSNVVRNAGSTEKGVARQWAKEWTDTGVGILDKVISYINELRSSLPITDNVNEQVDKPSTSHSNSNMLDDMFENVEPQLKRLRRTTNVTDELERFLSLEMTLKMPVTFFYSTESFPVLKKVAKFILATPVSSARVERMFSQSGLILSKLRRRMKPCLLQAIVYTKSYNMAKKMMQIYD